MIPRKIVARFCLLLATVGLLLPMQVFSLPNDPSVVAGQSSISQTADQMTITQTTDKAIINWGGYSIDVGELVQYLQPGANAVSLNRIVGGNPSEILGQLIANGQIFLINPSGIVFGESSRVNVPGLLATTLNISDEDFLAGNYTFSQDLQSSLSAVINKGTIIVQDNGYCVLVAPLVSNEGLIVANMGKVALGGAESFTVNFDGQNLINFAISAPAVGQPGTVLIPTGQVGDIIKGIVNSPALVEAGSVVEEGGMTYLGNASGTVIHSGTITVDGVAGKNAGSITIDSNLVSAIVPGAVLSASGVGAHSSGGEILILSDMEKGTALLAEGSTVEAKGGDISGDAGFVELSGNRFYLDNANIDLTVIDGNAGTFLLDPYNITIGNVDAGGSWASGTYTPTGSGNTISHSTIEGYLASSHVIVSTGLDGSPGGEAGNISLESEIASMSNYDLTLEAAGAITFNGGFIYRAAGSGKIILKADTINLTPVDPLSAPWPDPPITHWGMSGSLYLYVNTLNIGPVGPGERAFDVNYIYVTPFTPTRNIVLGATEAGSLGLDQNFFNSIFADNFKSMTIGNASHTGNIIVKGNVDSSLGYMGFGYPTSLETQGSIFSTGGSRITDGTLILNAGGDIDLLTQVANIRAVSTGGSIAISNIGDLAILNYVQTSGDKDINIELTGAGNTLYAGGANVIRATGTGDITLVADEMSLPIVLGSAAVQASGGNVTLLPYSAGKTIYLGTHPAGEFGFTFNQLSNVYGNTIIIGDTTQSGGIQITDNISASSLSLITGGSITNPNGTITVNNLSLTAGTGIGASGAELQTKTSTLTATTKTGGIYISNDGALTLNGATITGAGNNIDIRTGSPLTVAGAVSAPGDIFLQAGEDGGDNDHLTISANITSIGSGLIDLQAGANIIHTTGAISTAGNIYLLADYDGSGAGKIEQQGGSLSASGLQARASGDIDIINSAVSTLAVDATGDVDISNAKAGGLTVGTVGATSGISAASLALTETAGNITITEDITVTNDATITSAGRIVGAGGVLEADTLALTAGTGIMGATPVQTNANRLTATTGTGAIYISNNGALILDGAQVTGVGGDYINISSQGSLTVAGDVSTPGYIMLRALNIGDDTEDLTISANITSTGFSIITLSAGADIIHTSGDIATISEINLLADYDESGVGKIEQQGGSLSAQWLKLRASEDIDIINSAVQTLAVKTDGDIHIANTMATGLTVGAVGATSGITGASLTLTETAGALNIDKDITVTNDATLTAAGAIKDVTGDEVVKAAGLELISGAGITLGHTQVSTLAVDAVGAVDISNTMATGLTVGTVGATSGITAASLTLTETAGALNIDEDITVTNDATLAAAGAIKDVTGDEVVKAAGLELISGAGITLGHTQVSTLAVDAVGAVDISNTMATGLTVGTVGATSGISAASLTLTETAGALNIDKDITVTNDATLTAAGAIKDVTGDEVVKAAGLELISGAGITLGHTQVSTLAVNAVGAVDISNTKAGGLTVGTVGATSGISAASLTLTETAGALNIDKNITVTNNATLTAAGAIKDVTGDEVVAAAGLELISGAGVTLGHTQVSALAVDAVGDVDISNTKATGLTVGTVGATSGISAASLMLVENDGDIIISQPIVVAGSALIDTYWNGAILSTGAAPVDVTAIDLALIADQGIGTLANPIVTEVSQLSAINADSGDIYIVNTGTLELLDLTVFGLSVVNDAEFGVIDITNTGAITITDGVEAYRGDISITAHSPIAVNANICSYGGDIVLTANNVDGYIWLDSGVSIDSTDLATAGDITLTAYGKDSEGRSIDMAMDGAHTNTHITAGTIGTVTLQALGAGSGDIILTNVSGNRINVTTETGNIFDDEVDTTYLTASYLNLATAGDIGATDGITGIRDGFLDINAANLVDGGITLTGVDGSDFYLNFLNGDFRSSYLAYPAGVAPNSVGSSIHSLTIGVSGGNNLIINSNIFNVDEAGLPNGINYQLNLLSAGALTLTNPIVSNSDLVQLATAGDLLIASGSVTFNNPGGTLTLWADFDQDGTGRLMSGGRLTLNNVDNLILIAAEGILLTTEGSYHLAAYNDPRGNLTPSNTEITVDNIGDITVFDGTGWIGDPGVDVNGIKNIAGGDVTIYAHSNIDITAPINTYGGDLNLTATENITHTVLGDITTQGGSYTAIFNANPLLSGAYTMADDGSDWTVIDVTGGAGTGVVTIQSLAGTGGNIVVSEILADTVGGAITLFTSGGAIVETAADSSGVDLVANQLLMYAATGIGSGNEFETTVNRFGAINTGSGDIRINNTAPGGTGLTIIPAAPGVGIQNMGSGVYITEASPITVNAPITAVGNILLIANDTAGIDDGDITVSANISSTAGNVTLAAGNDITLGANVGAANLLTVLADDSSLATNNSSGTGSIIQGGGGRATAPTMVLSGVAVGAFGTPLEINAGTVTATSTGAGAGIYLNELNTVNLLDLQTTDGTISVVAGSGITATSVVTGNNNDISLLTNAGDITIVDLDAGSGSATITAVAGNIGDITGTITAGDAVLTAAGNIIVSSDVSRMQLTGGGYIDIINSGSLDLASIDIPGYAVVNTGPSTLIQVNGDLLISSDVDAAFLLGLVATGTITDANNATVGAHGLVVMSDGTEVTLGDVHVNTLAVSAPDAAVDISTTAPTGISIEARSKEPELIMSIYPPPVSCILLTSELTIILPAAVNTASPAVIVPVISPILPATAVMVAEPLPASRSTMVISPAFVRRDMSLLFPVTTEVAVIPDPATTEIVPSVV
jgi:filamentous hemagglutinin family protein